MHTGTDRSRWTAAQLEYEEYKPGYRRQEVCRIWKGNRYVRRLCDVYDLGLREKVTPNDSPWDSDADPVYRAFRRSKKPKMYYKKRRGLVVDYLNEVGEASASDIARHFGWNRASLTRMLKDCSDFQHRQVPGRGVRYVWRNA